MKTIKSKIITISIIIVSMIFIGSCNKRNNSELSQAEEQSQKNLEEITFSNDFEWNTSKNIELIITSSKSQVITISSEDESIRYHRGKLTDKGEYKITLNIPNTVNTLLINNKTVSINSSNITCNLDN